MDMARDAPANRRALSPERSGPPQRRRKNSMLNVRDRSRSPREKSIAFIGGTAQLTGIHPGDLGPSTAQTGAAHMAICTAHENDIAARKRAAACAAVAEIEDGMLVGLGSGSTASFAIAALGERVAAGLKVTTVATSLAAGRAAEAAGLPGTSLRHAGEARPRDRRCRRARSAIAGDQGKRRRHVTRENRRNGCRRE